MIYKYILIVFLIALGLGLFGNVFYKANKSIKYKNDERWQFIQNKANHVVNCYHGLILVVLSVMMIVDLFYPFQSNFSLSHIIYYAFIVLFLRYTIEFFSLVYFDKKL